MGQPQFEREEVGPIGWLPRVPINGGHQSRIYVCAASAIALAATIFLVLQGAPAVAYLVVLVVYATVIGAGLLRRR